MKGPLEPLLPLDDSPLRQLAGAIPVENPAHVEARRTALVGSMADEIAREHERTKRRRGQRRWLAGASAAAIVLLGSLAFVGARRAAEERADNGTRDGALVVGVSGTSHTLARPEARLDKGASLARGQIVVTEASTRLSLELAGRTSLELGEDSVVELAKLAPRDQAFFLRRGAIHVDVPHPEGLGARSVRVTTPEAVIAVKGTRFGVEVTSAGEPLIEYTRVWVERGSVEVRDGKGTRLLAAGESWRSDVDAAISAPTLDSSQQAERDSSSNPAGAGTRGKSPSESARDEKRPTVSRATGGTSAETRGSGEDAASLSTQNRLFEEALAAERAGNFGRAEEKLVELLARYPHSPLRAAARTELGRLHARE